MSDAVGRARRAFEEYEELKAAFDRLEGAIFAEMKQTPVGVDAKLQRLHLSLHNLADVKAALREVIDNGRIASQALAVAGLNRPN